MSKKKSVKRKAKHPKEVKQRNPIVPIMRKLKPGPHKNKRDRDAWMEWEKEYEEE